MSENISLIGEGLTYSPPRQLTTIEEFVQWKIWHSARKGNFLIGAESSLAAEYEDDIRVGTNPHDGLRSNNQQFLPVFM